MISTEDVKAIIDGCEVAAPGPWYWDEGGLRTEWDSAEHLIWPANAGSFGILAEELGALGVHAETHAAANAGHIASLSPEVVRSLLTELLALRQSSSFTQGYEQGREDAAKVADAAEKQWREAYGTKMFSGEIKFMHFALAANELALTVRSLPIPQAPGEKR